MTSSSSRKIHLSQNTKHVLAPLPDERKKDFQVALERITSNPDPDGVTKILIEGFPYAAPVTVAAGGGFQFLYKVQEDGSMWVGGIHSV